MRVQWAMWVWLSFRVNLVMEREGWGGEEGI
jgi:hypothetical protein